MKKIAVLLVHLYRNITGFLKRIGVLKDSCVFAPTCSAYAIEAIEKYGLIKGSYLACRRILRCHPWQKERWDPVE